jgi:hypothetical protein
MLTATSILTKPTQQHNVGDSVGDSVGDAVGNDAAYEDWLALCEALSAPGAII